MKIQKVSACQYRCNFCLDWHISKTGIQPPSSINICDQCFTKAKSSSYFKVLDPVELEVYEIKLRKTGLLSDESKSVNTQLLAELAEFYERTDHKDKVKVLIDYLVESDLVEMQQFKKDEPLRDMINLIYQT